MHIPYGQVMKTLSSGYKNGRPSILEITSLERFAGDRGRDGTKNATQSKNRMTGKDHGCSFPPGEGEGWKGFCNFKGKGRRTLSFVLKKGSGKLQCAAFPGLQGGGRKMQMSVFEFSPFDRTDYCWTYNK